MVRRIRISVVTAITPLPLLLVACAQGQPAATEESFDAKNFPEPTKITNQYLPLAPGTKFVFEGRKESIPLRVELLVTNQTKVVQGITTIVVSDKEFEAGQLVDETLDWFAQDNRGNVWFFGEYATQYRAGQVRGHDGSWEAGVKGAKPGIVMPASPESQVGRAYRQQVAPGVAEDLAKVVKLNESLCVPVRCFQGNVLVTEEWSRLDPEIKHKYYAPGVGNIRSIVVKGDPEKADLVAIEHVG